jgi:hypothetical protein
MELTKTISFYRKSSYLLMLGFIHSALTPVFYKFLTPDGMGFFGTGLSLVFLAFLNIAASKLLNLWLLKLTLAANIIGTLFSLLIVYVLKEPQAYIGLFFHAIVLLACIYVLKQNQPFNYLNKTSNQ